MFTCRQLILGMAIISLAKIIFGDILVQPGYKHQYRYNPSYLPYQTVSPYMVPSATERRVKQLAVQPLKQHPSGVQILHPYHVPKVYHDKVRPNLVGYPFHLLHAYPHHRYISTKPAGNLRYMKLGAREYTQPSIFIGHSNPLAAHYRYKRSADFTNVKSDESAIAAHDVAAKPSLIDTKYSTVIDSLLPENKSTNTNDKHVRTQNDFAANPFLFGLNPNRMYSKLQAENLDEKNETQHSVSKRNHATLITPFTPVILTQQPDPAKTTVTEAAQQTSPNSQNEEQSQEPSRTNPKDPNPSSTNLKQLTSLITTSQSSEEESHEDDSNYHDNYDKTFTSPMTITYRPTIPFTYNKYWPRYIIYNAEKNLNKKKDLGQQDNSNYQPSSKTSSQEINVGATNTDQTRHRGFTNFYASVPCSTNNVKKSSEAVQSIPELTPEQSPTFHFYKSNKESLARSGMIAAPNPGTPQVFYAIPDSGINYYFNHPQDSAKDYLDNLGTDYRDYDDKSTLLTDGFRFYLKKDPAYLSNAPSDTIDCYRQSYGSIPYSIPQSYLAPTYVLPTLSQVQLSDYYPKKARKIYITPKPHHYYKQYDTKNRIVPNVFYPYNVHRTVLYSPPVYY